MQLNNWVTESAVLSPSPSPSRSVFIATRIKPGTTLPQDAEYQIREAYENLFDFNAEKRGPSIRSVSVWCMVLLTNHNQCA